MMQQKAEFNYSENEAMQMVELPTAIRPSAWWYCCPRLEIIW